MKKSEFKFELAGIANEHHLQDILFDYHGVEKSYIMGKHRLKVEGFQDLQMKNMMEQLRWTDLNVLVTSSTRSINLYTLIYFGLKVKMNPTIRIPYHTQSILKIILVKNLLYILSYEILGYKLEIIDIKTLKSTIIKIPKEPYNEDQRYIDKSQSKYRTNVRMCDDMYYIQGNILIDIIELSTIGDLVTSFFITIDSEGEISYTYSGKCGVYSSEFYYYDLDHKIKFPLSDRKDLILLDGTEDFLIGEDIIISLIEDKLYLTQGEVIKELGLNIEIEHLYKLNHNQGKCLARSDGDRVVEINLATLEVKEITRHDGLSNKTIGFGTINL
jgi:hypothetical protein